MTSNKRTSFNPSDAEVYARLEEWLQPMREATPELLDDAVLQARLENTIETIEAAIRRAPAVAKRQQFGKNLWWAAAAAVVLAVGAAGYVQNREPNSSTVAQNERANLRQVVGRVVVTQPDGSDRMVTPDTQLQVGEEISTTAQAFVSLELDDQARIDLSSATTVKLERAVPREHSFYLRSGRVDVNVPKVAGEPRRLSVRTADTLVSVRGTIFSVEVAEQDEQTVTVVRVSRGSVGISFGGQDIILRSGERWSSRKIDAAPKLQLAPPLEGPTVPSAAKASSASSLARQNQLFEQGLRARDRGDQSKAQYWFERLVREYPSSPLIPSAKAELAKAQQSLSE